MNLQIKSKKRLSQVTLVALLILVTIVKLPTFALESIQETTSENRASFIEFLTINDAIEIALDHRLEIQSAGHQTAQRLSELHVANADKYPKLDLVSRVTRNEAIDDFEPIILNLDDFGQEGSLFPEKNLPDYRADSGIRLSQSLYTGGRITSKSDAAQRTMLAAKMKELGTSRQVAIETILGCWDLKLAQALLGITQEAEKQMKELSQKINHRFSKGTVSRLEWQRTETEYFSIKLARDRATKGYRAAIDHLTRTLGLDPVESHDITILDDETIIPEKPATPLTTIIAKALERRPEVREIEEQILSQTHKISFQKSRFLPSISIESEYAWVGYDERDPGSAIGDLKSDYWAVGVNYRMNLFEGGETYYQIAADAAVLADLNTRLMALKRAITDDIYKLHHLFELQHQIVETASYRHKLDDENLKMVMEEFRLGVASIDKVADYHERFFNSHRESLAALISLQKINAKLRWTAGMDLK